MGHLAGLGLPSSRRGSPRSAPCSSPRDLTGGEGRRKKALSKQGKVEGGSRSGLAMLTWAQRASQLSVLKHITNALLLCLFCFVPPGVLWRVALRESTVTSEACNDVTPVRKHSVLRTQKPPSPDSEWQQLDVGKTVPGENVGEEKAGRGGSKPAGEQTERGLPLLMEQGWGLPDRRGGWSLGWGCESSCWARVLLGFGGDKQDGVTLDPFAGCSKRSLWATEASKGSKRLCP